MEWDEAGMLVMLKSSRKSGPEPLVAEWVARRVWKLGQRRAMGPRSPTEDVSDPETWGIESDRTLN
jgi:hypothetical protein